MRPQQQEPFCIAKIVVFYLIALPNNFAFKLAIVSFRQLVHAGISQGTAIRSTDVVSESGLNL